ncbi:hypothetical protein Cmaq_0236 [Caldivirga maquilingensis IC-167]|uniref:Uncharacterized protein n=1 Tax=Caldivirga maquilingensis (strain ATCC 700844 / DSM 13496 / JCM 10307 / IC-167) TaxID=397948 RepID=A8MAP8_CALMQ|nr:hypothetical protein Cmaq_0236 [Caldivirga maquilingensis IC-167]
MNFIVGAKAITYLMGIRMPKNNGGTIIVDFMGY